MDNTTTTPEYLFESSWEVCNKVGGIYTVLSTKAHTLQRSFKDKLIFIGPDVWADTNAPDLLKMMFCLLTGKLIRRPQKI